MKVQYRKLGREKAYGQAHIGENTIEIDARLNKRKCLEIMIHEALHILNPEFSETKILNQSKKLAKVLWDQKYRKVDI